MVTTRRLEHPDADDLDLPTVLFALSDPLRLAIVRQLATGPVSAVSCQVIGPDLPKSTRSHHLKTLREAGVVRNEPYGRERRVSLRREDLDARFPGLLASVLPAAAAAALPPQPAA